MSRTLLGWLNPLPDFIEAAVHSGTLKIVTVNDRKWETYELLQGSVISPSGVLLVYR